jgi:hypothetical protein
MFWSRTCPQCDTKNSPSSVYCGACGARLAAIRCGCGADIPAQARVCPRCGRDAEGHEAPDMGRKGSTRPEAGTFWAREKGDVVTRLEPSDLVGTLQKGVELELGTEALLLQDGQYIGTLKAGRHTLEGIKNKLTFWAPEKHHVLYLYDAYDLLVSLKMGPFKSSDPFDVRVSLEAVLRLEDPAAFLVNVMKGLTRYTSKDIEAYVAAPLENSLRDSLASVRYGELDRSPEARQRVEQKLVSRLEQALRNTGLSLLHFRLLRFDCPFYDEKLGGKRLAFAEQMEGIRLDHAQEDVLYDEALQRKFKEVEHRMDSLGLRVVTGKVEVEEQRAEAKIAEEKESAALDHEAVEQGLDLRSLSQRAEHSEKRVDLIKRLLQGDNLARMAQLTSEVEWERFRQSADRERLLRDAEWDRIKAEIGAQQATEEMKRRQAQAVLEAMQRAELDEMMLLQQYRLRALEAEKDGAVGGLLRKNEAEQLDHEIGQKRKVLGAELQKAQLLFEQELEQRRRIAELSEAIQRGTWTNQLEKAKAAMELEQAREDMEVRRAQWAKDQEAQREILVRRETAAIDLKARVDLLEAESRARRLLMEEETRRKTAVLQAMNELIRSGATPDQLVAAASEGNATVLLKLAESLHVGEGTLQAEVSQQILALMKEHAAELRAILEKHGESDADKFRQMVEVLHHAIAKGPAVEVNGLLAAPPRHPLPPQRPMPPQHQNPSGGRGGGNFCQFHRRYFNPAVGCPQCIEEARRR